ncbi:RskA family anti-sigma factor [Nocardia sp. NPDC004415]
MNGQRGPEKARRGVPAAAPEILSGAEDREAVRELYRTTGAAAFGLALRVLHRRGLAEEVVREGFRRVRATPWITAEDDELPDEPVEPAGPPVPDLGTPWGRSAFVATRPDTHDLDRPTYDLAFGSGVVYGRDGDELPDHTGADLAPPRPEPVVFGPEQTWLLAQVHRLAVQRLRLDRNDGEDMPWLAVSARLGFDDPLDSHCEVFVLAYYGGRTYRAIGRELGLRVPMVTRLLAEGVERLAEQRLARCATRPPWCPPGSVLTLADAYALDAVAELEHHHIENKLAATAPHSLSMFAERVRAVHDVLARLADDDQRPPPRQLEAKILADVGAPTPRRGHWSARPPWLRRFGNPPGG